MPTYASNTTVTPERSREEIERTLQRYGATAFSYGWEQADSVTGSPRAVLMFRAQDRHVKFEVTMPSASEFMRTPTGKPRKSNQVAGEQAKAMRQRWRALALVVKAKLEAVETGITTFEEEFLAHIVLPSGETFGQWAQPQIAEAYEHGTMPGIMPGSQPVLTAGEVVDG